MCIFTNNSWLRSDLYCVEWGVKLCSNQTKSNGGLQCVMHVALPKQQKFSLNTHSDKSVYPSDFGFAK